MPYLMAGFPSAERSRAIAQAYADAGADLVELGFPFSDPLADGPVIHAAATAALKAGARAEDALAVGEAVSDRVPVVAMVYSNMVLAHGADAFVGRLRDAGIAGLIVPDLPAEEAADLLALCDEAGIALVPLVAPTTTDERMARVCESARGFVYAVSLAGTTGERDELPATLAETLRRAHGCTDLPVAAGFGIATPAQAQAAAQAGADGVIVGSRLVRAAGESDPVAVGAVVSELAAALSD
jgi:tryptophan synthase alpha chain